jgi:hypothetical protein
MSIYFILVIHLMATAFMTGLIWLIQIVHYPSFSYVESSRFQEFEAFHTKRITPIVAPMMLLELITLVILVFQSFDILLLASALTLIGVWLVTFFISIPCHSKLHRGADEKIIKKLVSSNWYRTIFWSIRTILICVYFFTY